MHKFFTIFTDVQFVYPPIKKGMNAKMLDWLLKFSGGGATLTDH